eukprot:CAMPEP_0172452244 /NCGR_PEP_ID=MMETSP1065-20121228/9969_1 /TAXON_ID=265537 /ORGANISM="Amphiprora paludosa, Strain CCMP125" /LENGTH=543 /DNA_ID=CAMNT_0013204281 /DNA_START=93 /DNA_END=1724 /DNA_ORIENTATION=+
MVRLAPCQECPSHQPSKVSKVRGFSTAMDHSHVHHHHIEPTITQDHHKTVRGSANIVNNGAGIQITFPISSNPNTPTTGTETSFFHASWLWSNDPDAVHPTSGQRLRSMSTFQRGWKVEMATVLSSSMVKTLQRNDITGVPLSPPPGCLHPIGTVYQLDEYGPHDAATNEGDSEWLHIVWTNQLTGSKSTSLFDLDWLQACRYDECALQRRDRETSIVPDTTLKRGDKLCEVQFGEWNATGAIRERARFDLLNSIFRDGATIIKGAPLLLPNSHEEVVGAVGKSLACGGLSHGSLYGDVFHVEAQPNAHNIASTSFELPPHHDLVYYESKPGLQLLHCVNNKGVSGGSSTLVDAFAAALAFKNMAPDLYEVLLKCEATFVKQRKNADMVYRKPHIQEDSTGSVVRVDWSPPFEGPMSVHPDLVDDYLLAYAAFERLLDKSLPRDTFLLPLPTSLEQQLMDYAIEHTWEQKLEMGDILIFSNQRMLHGRGAFRISSNGPDNGRHLVGCYTNIDDTLNEFRLLRRKYAVPGSYHRVAGNGSSGMI